MRYYWCTNCKKCVETDTSLNCSNKCGKSFLPGYNPGKHVNMRKTLSGTTKIEFNAVTMDESIKNMTKGE